MIKIPYGTKLMKPTAELISRINELEKELNEIGEDDYAAIRYALEKFELDLIGRGVVR